jgi:hypothetical protein
VKELPKRKFRRPNPYIAADAVVEPVIEFLRAISKPAEPDSQDLTFLILTPDFRTLPGKKVKAITGNSADYHESIP